MLVVFVAAAVASRQLEPRVHQAIVSRLSTSLESTVELGDTRLSFFPLRFRAESLTVRHHGRVDVPRCLVIQSLVAHLNLLNLWGQVIDRVAIEGMELNVPPRPEVGGPRLPMTREHAGGGTPDVVIRHLTATNTRIAVIPRESGKNPKVWDLSSLDMRDIATDAPASFTASVTNPIPTGNIDITGNFGPWQASDPASTPLDGTYTFAADLGTIKGIEGHLDAKGEMDGVFDRITTHGETTTERFRIPRLNAGSLLLKTRYQAVVDRREGGRRTDRRRDRAGALGAARARRRGRHQGDQGQARDAQGDQRRRRPGRPPHLRHKHHAAGCAWHAGTGHGVRPSPWRRGRP